MKGLRKRLLEFRQNMMARVANRTFKTNPGFLDRLLIRALLGPPHEKAQDPDLEHSD